MFASLVDLGACMDISSPVIFTIGHSSISFESFVALLMPYRVEVVVDVRSHPVSRFAPQFSRRPLAALLTRAGFRYAYMGDSLGGRPTNSQFYDAERHVLYYEWSESERFRAGLRRLMRAATKQRIALMCSEESPLGCHRHLLVARALSLQDWPRSKIVHIRGDGLCMPEESIAVQSGPFEQGITWNSRRSASRGPQRSTSLNG